MLLDEVIVSGVISKIINDFSDVSKSKIIKAVEDKKNKQKNLESQIYNIIVSVLKAMDDNSCENNLDKIYDSAEKLLITLKKFGTEGEDTVESALKNSLPFVDNDKCIEFKTLLSYEVSKNEYSELYRRIRLRQEEKKYRKTDRIEKKIDNLDKKLDTIGKNDVKNAINSVQGIKFHNNKKHDYVDNWNSRLFLHIDNDERPITLADVFIMPYFKFYLNDRRIEFFEYYSTNEIIENFVKYNRSANMLIVGAPGIGKTSIVSWMANQYKKNDDIIILRFRDWEREELGNGISAAICRTLDCSKRDLENKIIILDGFDEIKVLDDGKNLIRNFLDDVLDFKNLKVIVTSRNDYIEYELFQYAFGLLPFQIDEIKQFYHMITGSELKSDLNNSNLDVLGIPVILYMAIMSNIDITKEATKPELYNRIFAEQGGIFDKFSFCGEGYDYGNQILRDKKNIKKYLGFLQETAFRMFDADKLSLHIEEDKIPKLSFQGTEVSILEFPIKHLFDKTATKIEFVHKSVYEYFVSEYIIQNLCNFIVSNDYKEKSAYFFGKTFLHGEISHEIIEFLKYKISDRGLDDAYEKIAIIFQLMLEDGMLYHTNKLTKKAMECDMRVFVNMLEILHLWDKHVYSFDDQLSNYIYYNKEYALNLIRADLRGENLSEASLKRANLREANLRKTVLQEANLKEANLYGADLQEANLQEANLREANLQEANLQEANLSAVNLTGADLSEAKLIKADLSRANLKKAELIKTDLRGANLKEANLREADLIEANLRGADLREADLRKVNLRGADLIGSNLINAILEGMFLHNLNLRGAIIDERQLNYLKEKCELQDVKVYLRRNKEIVNYKEYCERNL